MRQESCNAPRRQVSPPRGAAKDQRFGHQQRRVLGDIGVQAAFKPRGFEQDGFLRNPFENRAGAGFKRHVDFGDGAKAAIDFLSRRGGETGPRPGTKAERDFHSITPS